MAETSEDNTMMVLLVVALLCCCCCCMSLSAGGGYFALQQREDPELAKLREQRDKLKTSIAGIKKTRDAFPRTSPLWAANNVIILSLEGPLKTLEAQIKALGG